MSTKMSYVQSFLPIHNFNTKYGMFIDANILTGKCSCNKVENHLAK